MTSLKQIYANQGSHTFLKLKHVFKTLENIWNFLSGYNLKSILWSALYGGSVWTRQTFHIKNNGIKSLSHGECPGRSISHDCWLGFQWPAVWPPRLGARTILVAKAMSALPWLIKRSRGLHFFRFLSLSFIFFLGQHYCNNHLLQVIEVLAILIYVASSFFFITAWQRTVQINEEADAHAQYWVGLPIDAYTAWPDRDSQFNYPKVRINEVRINKHLLYNFLCL